MKQALDKLRNLLAGMAVALFALIFCLIVVEIVCRNFLGFSLLWVTDFIQLVVCWMLAFGMSAIVYTDDHLRITFIREMLPEKGRRGANILCCALELVFFLLLVPYGAQMAQTKMKISFTTLRWPMGFQFAALPVFGALCSLFMLYRLCRSVREWKGGRAHD